MDKHSIMPRYCIVEVDKHMETPPPDMSFDTRDKAEFALKFIKLYWAYYILTDALYEKYLPTRQHAALSEALAELRSINRQVYGDLRKEGGSKWGSYCPFYRRLQELT